MYMKLYKTAVAAILEREEKFYLIEEDWDALVNRDGLYPYLEGAPGRCPLIGTPEALGEISGGLRAPIGAQEVWAAGVTYLRSRDARMDESRDGGGADFYQKVYEAERPELFFKALPHRVSGPGAPVHIRKDSVWNVPEPELTLCINRSGELFGYTIGNDMSSRSIEGENPLYLPQAKSYDRSAALGPCILVTRQPLASTTAIRLLIQRSGHTIFTGAITIANLKRSFSELISWLYRECSFPQGCYLMTGTGIVPPDDFTLATGDVVEISIDGIGLLRNTVATRPSGND